MEQSRPSGIQQALLKLLNTEFPDAMKIECVAEDSCHGNIGADILVVAQSFEGVPLLKRHQSVQACLEKYPDRAAIHKITLKTYTPEQAKGKGLLD